MKNHQKPVHKVIRCDLLLRHHFFLQKHGHNCSSVERVAWNWHLRYIIKCVFLFVCLLVFLSMHYSFFNLFSFLSSSKFQPCQRYIQMKWTFSGLNNNYKQKKNKSVGNLSCWLHYWNGGDHFDWNHMCLLCTNAVKITLWTVQTEKGRDIIYVRLGVA